jgi:hypothetical protein
MAGDGAAPALLLPTFLSKLRRHAQRGVSEHCRPAPSHRKSGEPHKLAQPQLPCRVSWLEWARRMYTSATRPRASVGSCPSAGLPGCERTHTHTHTHDHDTVDTSTHTHAHTHTHACTQR